MKLSAGRARARDGDTSDNIDNLSPGLWLLAFGLARLGLRFVNTLNIKFDPNNLVGCPYKTVAPQYS